MPARMNQTGPRDGLRDKASLNHAALAGLLLFALALRMALVHFRPNIIWPDEIYQVVEPAYRLVHGTGATAWEFVVGMRSWLFPGIIAGVLWVAGLFGSAPAVGLTAVALFMALLSLLPVAVAYRWGERLEGAGGGLIAGSIAAIWIDMLYFAPHPLSDVIASDVMMVGFYAAFPLTARAALVRLFTAGVLFGLAFALRMQLGPALLVAAIFACGRSTRAWGALIAGGSAALLPAGCLDWIILGTPFQSIWLNFWLNVVKGVSTDFGTQPPHFYVAQVRDLWGVAGALLIAVPLLVGARRFPALLAVAATIFVTQSLFQHKELRFLYPALPPIVTLCGIGTVLVIQKWRPWWSRYASAPVPVVIALLAWTLLSLVLAMRPAYTSQFSRRRELIDAFALATQVPSLCGVELFDISWTSAPGSVALPARVPLYASDSENAWRDAAGYNVAVVHHFTPSRSRPFTFAKRYRRVGCFAGTLNMDGTPMGTACVWVRDGGCTAGVAETPDTLWPSYFRNPDDSPRLDRIRLYAPHYRTP
jgi:hypothetical protein